MNTDIRAFNGFHLPGEHATYPIAQLAGRLAVLLLLVGGAAMPRRRAYPDGPPAAHSNTSNCGFQDYEY
jgi:hypothetical protein